MRPASISGTTKRLAQTDLALLLPSILALAACGGDPLGVDFVDISQIGDGSGYPGTSWDVVASPEDLGWSSSRLADARAYSEEIGSGAVVIVDRGILIDQWGQASTRGSPATISSSVSIVTEMMWSPCR